MILDGLIIWIANSTLVSPDGLHDIKELLDFILKSDDIHSSKVLTATVSSFNMKFCNPTIWIGFHLAVLSQRCDAECHDGTTKYLEKFINSVQAPSQIRFCDHIQLFLRGIFLNSKTSTNNWMKVFGILLKIVDGNQDVAIGLLLPVLFKLSREKVPSAQLELLRGLTQFAVIKVR